MPKWINDCTLCKTEVSDAIDGLVRKGLSIRESCKVLSEHTEGELKAGTIRQLYYRNRKEKKDKPEKPIIMQAETKLKNLLKVALQLNGSLRTEVLPLLQEAKKKIVLARIQEEQERYRSDFEHEGG
jgi:hypothetical protein